LNVKKFKPVHWLYNLIHYRSLRHNKEAFRKFKVHKPLIGSISSRDFPDRDSKAWLDTGNSRDLAPARIQFSHFAPQIQDKILNWSENGYMILENFLDGSACDAVNEEIDILMRKKKIGFTNGKKLMDVYRKSRLIHSIARNQNLLDLLQFILDREVVLFQTINFLNGSEQRAHSDSIHMTTYPLGFLIAGWIALEDISKENGPLFYYPGSHKLPYLLNSGYNEGETFITLGKKEYKDYEDVLEELVHTRGCVRKEFYAGKGDLLIWHANLVHGGAPIRNKTLTRKSMVMHYFAKDVIKYHEITERPSLLTASSFISSQK
jgi:ectoine hydroxylase-related dioxygenase (phytanoyl-CoA dioxygenase family)